MIVLILGATGFVGHNIYEVLVEEFICLGTSRNDLLDSDVVRYKFDISVRESWDFIVDLNPDVIVNCIAYGVIKSENDTNQLYEVNYFNCVEFYIFLSLFIPNSYIIHIGTAFEYSLNGCQIDENTSCIPTSNYGASKWLISNFLLNNSICNKFTIVRPFNMFGPHEHSSKIIPALILAQIRKVPIQLTSGKQLRDFNYVRDLGSFLIKLIKIQSKPKVVNYGNGEGISIRTIANVIKSNLSEFDEKYWCWGNLKSSLNEPQCIVNSSLLGFNILSRKTDISIALLETIKHYEIKNISE